MLYSLGKLTATGLAITFLIACGSGGAEPTPVPVVLTAEVCTVGEARDTKLYVKNLDDYEWRGISMNLVKAGETYTGERASLSPESQQPAEPFAGALEFSYLRSLTTETSGPLTTSGNTTLRRLHNFSNLESATIEIKAPQPGEWAGEVHPCQ